MMVAIDVALEITPHTNKR